MESKKLKKKQVKKLTSKQIMSLVVDESLLKEKKKQQQQKQDDKPNCDESDERKEKDTWFSNLSKKDFIKKEKDGNFYARHIKWKENVWIGAYDSEKEVDFVINSYIKEIKKPPIDRNIKNIHSIVSNDI